MTENRGNDFEKLNMTKPKNELKHFTLNTLRHSIDVSLARHSMASMISHKKNSIHEEVSNPTGL